MSFLIDTAENVLKLTPEEKKVANAALPTLAVWVHMLNEQWGTLINAVSWVGNSKAIALRLIADGQTLGPIIEDIVTDKGSIIEATGAMAPINDAKAMIEANPKLIAALRNDYQKLAPLIAQIESDMAKPEMQAFATLLQNKMLEHNLSGHQLASKLLTPHDKDA